MDFNAPSPKLVPLEKSGAITEYESQLKSLALDLWSGLLADRSADIGVLGAPHLGSFSLVQRELNSDGLILIKSDNEEGLTRYLYKAFRSGKLGGRGLHFLRTYLQMLYPNAWEIEQVWCTVDDTYPNSTAINDYWAPHLNDPDPRLDGTWQLSAVVPWRTPGSLSDRDYQYQTSRVIVYLDYTDVDIREAGNMLSILRSIVPAKIVPQINLRKFDSIDIPISVSATFKEHIFIENSIDVAISVDATFKEYLVPELGLLALFGSEYYDSGTWYVDTGQTIGMNPERIESNSRPGGNGTNFVAGIDTDINNASDEFELNGPGTVEAWLYRPSGQPESRRGVLSTWPSHTTSGRSGWSVFEYYANLAVGLYDTHGSTVRVLNIPLADIPHDEWFHFAYTRGRDFVAVYINGTQVAHGTIDPDFVYQSPRPLTLSYRYSSDGVFKFDEVRIVKNWVIEEDFTPEPTLAIINY